MEKEVNEQELLKELGELVDTPEQFSVARDFGPIIEELKLTIKDLQKELKRVRMLLRFKDSEISRLKSALNKRGKKRAL